MTPPPTTTMLRVKVYEHLLLKFACFSHENTLRKDFAIFRNKKEIESNLSINCFLKVIFFPQTVR